MTDITRLEQLTSNLETPRGVLPGSDLPERAFTGLGRLVQRDLKERGRVPPQRLEQLRTEANAGPADLEAVTAMAETDADGRITGAMGLTTTPTAHQFHVDGHQLYTWCAFDGIVFPIAHDWTADVHSVCPTTHQPITMTVTPQAVTGLEPPEAVLGVAVPTSGASPATADEVKAAFCSHNNLYASAQAAREATAGDPELVVVSVADAHRFGQRLVQTLDPAGGDRDAYACTLSEEELPARADQLNQLTAGLKQHEHGDREVRLHFQAALEPVVNAFVRDETRCCAFYDFAVHRHEDTVELVVRAPAGAEALLASLEEAFTSDTDSPS